MSRYWFRSVLDGGRMISIKKWLEDRKRKKLTKNVILYLLWKCDKLGIKVGRKKLMKLMFLIEYYDPKAKKLRKKPLLGNEWYIYYY